MGPVQSFAALPKMEGATAKTVVENSVLLAKAHRWPEGRVRRAREFLVEAQRIVDEDRTSRLQDRVERRAQIACGYARLGRFHEARDLSDGANVECRLQVAIQMLINEVERMILQGFDTRADLAKGLGRCWTAFDQD